MTHEYLHVCPWKARSVLETKLGLTFICHSDIITHTFNARVPMHSKFLLVNSYLQH